MITSISANLARSITWASSKQSYLTARLLADRDLVDDCLRAYAFFRWADDRIDICLSGKEECIAFIERQKNLINSLYHGRHPNDLLPEEAMLADLIAHDRTPDSGLHSFILNFMSVIEFDAYRKGSIASRHELATYTTSLATAVMDGLQYFIGNKHTYPRTHNRHLAVTGAHITHMLRDTLEDLSTGLVNIPAEDMEAYGIDLEDLDSKQMRSWVHDQVELARFCFQEGKTYIDTLEVLRCKLAGVWYCARFEWILNAIERDGYRLRAEYHQRRALRIWLEMARRGVVVILKHFARRTRLFFLRLDHPAGLDSKLNIPSYHIKKA
jgi:phytoene/squalene synthetase